ncbi:MAG: universal stress protein [Bacteroidota bacterium]
MKEIVAGIDFSRSSIQAFQYALRIAMQCGCRLKLVYVSKLRDKEMQLIKDDKGMEMNIRHSLEKLIDEHKNQVKGGITYRILTGKIYEEISNQAKYTDAGMIVAGAHGMSGFEEFWLGNNALKIITHSEKPVLSVKRTFQIKTPLIEKIVLPIDSTPETIQKVPFTLQLAQYFKAQINVLSLFSSRAKNVEENVERNTKEVMNLIVKTGLRYINENSRCDNISKATVDYCLRRNADLISIMTLQEHTSNRVFMGSYAEQTVNRSPIPVLSFTPQRHYIPLHNEA